MWTLLSKSGQEARQSKAGWGAYLPVRTCDRDRGQLEVMTYSLREDNLVDDLGEDFLTRKPKMNFPFFGVAVKRRKLLPQWRLQAPILHSYFQIHMKRTQYIFPPFSISCANQFIDDTHGQVLVNSNHFVFLRFLTCIRSYHREKTGIRLITKAKTCRERIALGWLTP